MDNGSDDRDSLSTVSTILGLALFFIFVAVVLIRRLYLHRVNRLVHTRVLGSRIRVELDGDDHEPRTIAIGARAALLRKPILWEDYLIPLSDPKAAQVWSHLQPMNLQLTTPHTTAQFPAKSVPAPPAQGLGRLRRLSQSHSRPYAVLHETSTNTPSQPSTPLPTSSPQRHSALAPRSSIDPPLYEPKPLERSTSEPCPHPVHVTVLISMPDPSFPSSTKSPPNMALLSRSLLSYSKMSLNAQIPPLELGTTSPIVQLSSISISRAELDSWWNLPAVSSRRGMMGMGRQTERERIRDILGASLQNYP